ncbi:MAG: 3-dehydroquinate synthase [Deltaproteobacteria bacterium]|nr:3-dehydroquinate synthase [Deltaproteobacteria bacterium]MBW2041981.1 3-dehydroquinate synthase [Deltaproteobacteria bacterium]MBW2132347.1 3-dehydroquinate synthase [Deltaproteobacteria bacterium]
MLPEIQINGYPGLSRIFIGESLENLASRIPCDRFVILTDSTVYNIYGKRLPEAPVISIGTGEAVKTLKTAGDVYTRLMELKMDRSDFLAGVGGGIVCDMAGFVAATFLRGIRFGFAPTTLLAQVDAAIGGKNGVNFNGYKNMIGTIRQPEFVLCDPGVLRTLPPKEYSCGLAEILKHAVIASPSLVDFMEIHTRRILARDPSILETLIYESAGIKASIVSVDERESGQRRKLNFGHTFGHAVEALTGLPHGHAVSIGMVMAAELSVQRGLLNRAEARRLIRLLEALELPTAVDTAPDRLFDALEKDKKREGDVVHFVFLDRLGNARTEPVSLETLKKGVQEVNPDA